MSLKDNLKKASELLVEFLPGIFMIAFLLAFSHLLSLVDKFRHSPHTPSISDGQIFPWNDHGITFYITENDISSFHWARALVTLSFVLAAFVVLLEIIKTKRMSKRK